MTSLKEIKDYISSVGLPANAHQTYDEIVERIKSQRDTDVAHGRPAVPESAIPGIALVHLEKSLAEQM